MCQRVSKHTALTSKYSLFSRCTAKPGCLFGCAKTAKDMSSHPMLKCPIYTAFNVSFCHRSHSFAGFCVAFMQKTDCLKMPWRENAPIHVLSSAHMTPDCWWALVLTFCINSTRVLFGNRAADLLNIYRLLELNMLCDCVTRGCGDPSSSSVAVIIELIFIISNFVVRVFI